MRAPAEHSNTRCGRRTAGWQGSLLFAVSPLDPLVFTGAALTLGAIALLASWVPARRAARVDPLVAMRQDA
jgi:ABC-type lipoprotein release transport system permease subunit